MTRLPPQVRAAAVASARQPARFERMVTINLRHLYRNRSGDPRGGACRDLDLQPTPQTVRRLSRYGLLVRKRPDGLEILHSTRHSEALEKALKAERRRHRGGLPKGTAERLFGPPLLFTVRIVDPSFLNVTAPMPGIGSGSKALVLSNRRLEEGEIGRTSAGAASARLRVEPGRTLRNRPPPPPRDEEVDGEADRKPPSARTKTYPQPLGKAGHGAEAEWWRETGSDFLAARMERHALAYSMRGLPFALLELQITARTGEEGGLFPIVLEPAEGGGHMRPVSYDIVFPARRTLWRYIVADRDGSFDEDSLAIAEKRQGGIAFTSQGECAPPPGARRAFGFVSPEPLTLEERPTRRLQLKGRRSSSRRSAEVLLDPLPMPGPALLSLPGKRGAEYSEIHLFP